MYGASGSFFPDRLRHQAAFRKNQDVGVCVEMDVNEVTNTLLDFIENREFWHERGEKGITIGRQYFDAPNVARLMARAFEDIITDDYSEECRWLIP